MMILSFSLMLLGYTYRVNAETVCYDVEGEVTTNNISSTQQAGNLEFFLTNKETGEELSLEGDLTGMIIDADEEGAIYLTHTATSNDPSNPFTFITLNDRAVFSGAPEGCTIPVSETITNIIGGTGFTENVISVDIVVNGAINYINAGECLGVPNTFEDISGSICLNH